MGTHRSTWFAVALALLLVTSSAGAMAMGSTPDDGALNGTQEDDSVGPADEVYVDGDGDAVLVYRNDAEESTTNGHFGADLSEGLFHVFLNDTIEEPMENDFAGNASFVLGPESMNASGAFSMARPESVEDLTFDASATQTRQESTGSMTLDATFVDDSSTGATTTGSVSTEGSMTSTASMFRTQGTATVTPDSDQAIPSSSRMNQEFTLSETDAGYTLTAAQEYTVGQYSADAWNTRENATRTLEGQFAAVASQLDGNADVSVDAYAYDEAENQLDIEYSVEFTGVDEAVSEQLATSLSTAQDLDLSESEANDLAGRIQSVELTELSAAVDVQADGASANWNVRLDNYDEAATATLDILEASEMDSEELDIETARSRLEAQQAAELEQTVTWEGEAAVPDAETATVQFDMESSTENWAAYVSELEDRGVEWGGDTTFEAHAETQNGELTASGSATFSQEGLIDSAIDSALQNADAAESPTAENEQVRSFLRSFQQSEFETARMDASVDDGEVTFEAGASFENVSAFRDVLTEAYGDEVAVESAVGTYEDGEAVTYVRMPGAVGSDAGESDVRDLSMVGEDTEVNMPDDWDPDEKSFPEMDTGEARNYLGIENDDGGDGGDDESSSSLPGFGPVVALVALVAVALVARRRAA